jgi:hypothetical protein
MTARLALRRSQTVRGDRSFIPETKQIIVPTVDGNRANVEVECGISSLVGSGRMNAAAPKRSERRARPPAFADFGVPSLAAPRFLPLPADCRGHRWTCRSPSTHARRSSVIPDAQDPGYYTQPRTTAWTYRYSPKIELMDYFCTENERDREHIVGK